MEDEHDVECRSVRLAGASPDIFTHRPVTEVPATRMMQPACGQLSLYRRDEMENEEAIADE